MVKRNQSRLLFSGFVEEAKTGGNDGGTVSGGGDDGVFEYWNTVFGDDQGTRAERKAGREAEGSEGGRGTRPYYTSAGASAEGIGKVVECGRRGGRRGSEGECDGTTGRAVIVDGGRRGRRRGGAPSPSSWPQSLSPPWARAEYRERGRRRRRRCGGDFIVPRHQAHTACRRGSTKGIQRNGCIGEEGARSYSGYGRTSFCGFWTAARACRGASYGGPLHGYSYVLHGLFEVRGRGGLKGSLGESAGRCT